MLYYGIKKDGLEKSLNTFSLAANILKKTVLHKAKTKPYPGQFDSNTSYGQAK